MSAGTASLTLTLYRFMADRGAHPRADSVGEPPSDRELHPAARARRPYHPDLLACRRESHGCQEYWHRLCPVAL
jgi:hypothetical protein